MTTSLVLLANDVPLPATPGVSVRACRAVLRAMTKIAADDGSMRYGLRASKIAALVEYSTATVRRAERYLVEAGIIERVQVGGGRASTRWKVRVDRLGRPSPPSRSGCLPAERGQLGRAERGQDRSLGLFSRIFRPPWLSDWGTEGASNRLGTSPGPSWSSRSRSPAQHRRVDTRNRDTSVAVPPNWSRLAVLDVVNQVCEHGGRNGLMSSGQPFCPSCRRVSRQEHRRRR